MTDAPAGSPTAALAPQELPFARSFGSEALRYDQARPSYPAAALDHALAGLARAPVGALAGSASPSRRIVDLGAGTGKLTAALPGRGAQVIAVEPDRQRLAVLAARLPQVGAVAGSAERLPLRDGSVDAVVAGQAFHWFARPDCDREIARVVRPGGVVGLIWNFPDRSVEWVPKLYQLTRQPKRSWSAESDHLDSTLFTEPEQTMFASHHRLAGPEGLRDLVHTWSWVITRSAAEQDAIDQRLRILVSQYAELQGPVVVLSQHTAVILQHRR